jgi:hypothetical protein
MKAYNKPAPVCHAKSPLLASDCCATVSDSPVTPVPLAGLYIFRKHGVHPTFADLIARHVGLGSEER